MAKRVTIREVAELAGVSKSLAAMVFASEDGVSPARRGKVLQAAKLLGYSPNHWARSLRSGSGQFVAILVADLHNPLFTEVADLVRKQLSQDGIFSFVSTASVTELDGKRYLDPEPIQNLLDLKPRSLLVVGGLPEHEILKEISRNVHLVVALTAVENLEDGVVVRGDDDDAMRLLLDHLVSQGHKEIAYIGPDNTPVAKFRQQAYKTAMAKHGLGSKVKIQVADITEDGGFSAAMSLLQEEPRPTSLICYNDNVALGAQDAVEQHVRVGGLPVAVTGYDNTFIARLGKVSLTSIEQEKEVIAEKVSELLTDAKNFETNRGQEILLHPRLFIRNSSLVSNHP